MGRRGRRNAGRALRNVALRAAHVVPDISETGGRACWRWGRRCLGRWRRRRVAGRTFRNVALWAADVVPDVPLAGGGAGGWRRRGRAWRAF